MKIRHFHPHPFPALVVALLLLVFQVMAVFAQEPTPTPALPPPQNNGIQVDQPRAGESSGQGTEVTFAISAPTSPDCQGIPAEPLDVILVLDASASAGIGPGSNWEHSQQIMSWVVDQLQQPVYPTPTAGPQASRLGVVSSITTTQGAESTLIQQMTGDYSAVRGLLQRVSPSSDTEIKQGLEAAVTELKNKSGEGRAKAIVMVLHDNVPLNPKGLLAIQETSLTYPVYMLVNNLNLAEEDRISPAMSKLAVPDDRIFIDPIPSDIRRWFVTATGGKTERAGIVHIEHTLNPQGKVRVVDLGGAAVKDGNLQWDLALNAGDQQQITYRVDTADTQPVEVQSRVTWIDCNGYLHNHSQSNSMQVQQNGNPDGGLVTDPGAGPIGGGIDQADGGLLVWLTRDNRWLWLLPLLLLLLLLAWLLWYLLHRQKKVPVARTVQPAPVVAWPAPVKTEPEVYKGTKDVHTGEDALPWMLMENVTDSRGRQHRMRLRFEPPADPTSRLQSFLPMSATMNLVDEVGPRTSQLGNAELRFEPMTEVDNALGITNRWLRMRVVALSAEPRAGVDTAGLVLDQCEVIANKFKASELVIDGGNLPPEFKQALSQPKYRDRAIIDDSRWLIHLKAQA